MDSNEKISQLRNIIRERLQGQIDRDYYLLELPYYTNIGDILIWQGEEEYLKTIPYKCKGRHSLETFPYPVIDENTMILFQGGGNFGDIWIKHHDFKMQVVEKYPQCKVLFFPQTIYFKSEDNLHKCAEFLSHYPNVTICARDEKSYELLRQSFKNPILLVPDMAFYISEFKISRNNSTSDSLLLKRNDVELKETKSLTAISHKNVVIHDWPSMEHRSIWTQILIKAMPKLPPKWMDWYCNHLYRPHLLRCGCQFISRYKKIYSTRLHGAILSFLLGKEVVILDNSYGKNKCFYDTWLADTDGITFQE